MSESEAWRTRLASAIHLKGVKVTHLSTDLGLHRDYISNVLSGKAKPSMDRVRAICDALDVSLAYVLDGAQSDSVTNADLEVEARIQTDALNSLQDLLRSKNYHHP
ncbi:helix-turn-helix domain-containing protein [Oceanomicrobium pacificus]|uniref:Helix-turn-helix domain-containing protein n=1 Tax=Oceanomicrobium pacificus TaxID=2692916 RepID=A0A6B0TQ54_9RHOB|nr:helix-turn-helix transcriptional regulator [Oceanomicrobium pacificus]MXU66777.1 helix-turn-helix domain-containing protein [Oceanomicrobium pacificus]